MFTVLPLLASGRGLGWGSSLLLPAQGLRSGGALAVASATAADLLAPQLLEMLPVEEEEILVTVPKIWW